MAYKNKDEDSEIEFEDVDKWKKSSDIHSMQQIVLKQLEKCIDEESKEMDGGGLRNRVIDGNVIEIIVQNQREIFINSTEALWYLTIDLYEKNKKEVNDAMENIDNNLEKIDAEHNKRKKRIDDYYRKKIVKDKRYISMYNSRTKLENDNYELDRVQLYKVKLAIIIRLLSKIKYGVEEGSVIWERKYSKCF